MSKEGKVKIGLKKTVGHEEAVAILEDILKSFKAGNMVVQNGEESVTLTTSDAINLEIKAKTKKLKNKFSMELSWKSAPPETEDFSITEAANDAVDEDKSQTPEFPKARVIQRAD